MNRLWAGVFLMFFTSAVFAQEPDTNRYFVYFKHKGAADYPYSLTSPKDFLTQASINRRSNQNIALDSSDLPVHPIYLDRLRELDIDVFFSSKWLNGALIQTHQNKEDAIKSLNFVDSVRLIAKGPRIRYLKEDIEIPENLEEPPYVEADSEIQLVMLGADIMHSDGFRGQNIKIAVLDNGFTGVNKFSPFRHIWENNQIIGTKDFVENSGNVFQFGSHGTSVFSIIGAFYETASTEFHGIAYNADFILCVTEDDEAENTIEEYNWILGAEYADSLGADVINTSLGYRFFDIDDHNYDFEELDGKTSIITNGATLAAQKGIIVVTSAGNSGRQSAPGNLISHPADAENILTIGSVDPNFKRSAFSSVGPTADGRIKPDVSAFGNGTAIMLGNGGIERGGGTSFSAPLVAGFAAGIWQANPGWTSQQVINAIKNSGHKVHSVDNLLGYGVPNYTYAVNGEMKALDVADILNEKFTIYPNPFRGDTLYIKTNGQFSSGMTIKVLDPGGSVIFDRNFEPEEITHQMEISLDSSRQGVYFLFLQTGNDQKVVKLINF